MAEASETSLSGPFEGGAARVGLTRFEDHLGFANNINPPGTLLSNNPSLLLDEEGILRAAWADPRYTVKTYSFPELFNSPNWANSDVMVSTIREGRRGRARVVTPLLSGIASGPKLCRLPSGEVFLFWGGQKKVGKTRDQFGCPTEVFFARVF